MVRQLGGVVFLLREIHTDTCIMYDLHFRAGISLLMMRETGRVERGHENSTTAGLPRSMMCFKPYDSFELFEGCRGLRGGEKLCEAMKPR